ncbi:hypothetical protein Bca4012_009221 [Brassica carinata]
MKIVTNLGANLYPLNTADSVASMTGISCQHLQFGEVAAGIALVPNPSLGWGFVLLLPRFRSRSARTREEEPSAIYFRFSPKNLNNDELFGASSCENGLSFLI